VTPPYNFDLQLWRNNQRNYDSGWQQKYPDKCNPLESEVHEHLNRFLEYCRNANRHIYEFGSQIHGGLIFSKIPQAYTAFERLRKTQPKKFIEPSKINKDDLQAVCRWIEGMYKEILLKWRVPITSEIASEWFKNAKLPTNDFTELRTLVENIRRYAEHLDSWLEGKRDEGLILKQIQQALARTDRHFGVQSSITIPISVQII
jgi:hypothetical protein